jgi:hypothetical protein
MKVVDYKLVESNSGSDFDDKVKYALRNGWQPWESPICKYQDGLRMWLYAQAFVKYAKET